jgi:hypothetical protein
MVSFINASNFIGSYYIKKRKKRNAKRKLLQLYNVPFSKSECQYGVLSETGQHILKRLGHQINFKYFDKNG